MKIFLSILISSLLYCNIEVKEEKIKEAIKYIEQSKLNKEYIFFVDMSEPSNKKRLFVYDVKTEKKIFESYVSHGKGSGTSKWAEIFSDVPNSKATSLGKYKVGESYYGKHGKSYKLKGLEKSNRNAESRAIVIHGAWYVEEDFIKKYNRCGNSFGCPAMSEKAFKECERYFKKDVLFWIYN